MSKYQDFIQALQNYCDTAVSGYIFFTSTDNRSGRVVLDDGNIISISYANQRGNRALNALAGVELDNYRYDQLMFAGLPDRRLPDSATILQQLSANVRQPASASGIPKAMTATAADNSTAHISEAAVTLIEDKLTDLIGPMAGLLCEDYVYNAKSTTAALTALSTELSDDESKALKQLLIANKML